jgi:NAD(P)-dependent dehydrogenase (short-subunit alcohol dehydrogenase family)
LLSPQIFGFISEMPPFTPASLPPLNDKVFLVTGGNAGIGYQAILHLVRKGAIVYMGCRSLSKGSAAIAAIESLVPSAKVHPLVMDHMSLPSIVSAAKNFLSQETKLHGLINNAGIMAIPFERSEDGYESQWQTNYLAHFLLTYHLLPLLQSTALSAPAGTVRIVNVSSGGHKTFAPKGGIDFGDLSQVESGGVWSRYGQSKLANVLHAKQLDAQYGPRGAERGKGEIWCMSLHPGNIYTDLSKNALLMGSLSKPLGALLNVFGVFIPAEEGAWTSVFCAASEEVKEEMSGGYFVPIGKLDKGSKHANNMAMAEKLWKWTTEEFRGKGLI